MRATAESEKHEKKWNGEIEPTVRSDTKNRLINCTSNRSTTNSEIAFKARSNETLSRGGK